MTETILPSNLLCAKTYARRGWAVFPVHSPRNGGTCSCGDPSCRAPGKHPRTATGLKEATTDPGKIQTWWDTWPDANIGVVTGRTEGAALLCVDIDPRHGGNDTLNALELTHGILPPHLIARTGGGGSHHIFSIPDGERIRSGSGKLGPGVDVKGEGGYFIAAPSLHVSGNRYEWVNLDPILGNKEHRPEDNLPPTWLLELLGNGRPSAPGAPPTGGGPSLPEKITEGGRNDTLFRLSASLLAKGLGKEAIQAALLVENRARCQPPLPEDEVRSIAGSAGRYLPGALPPVSTMEHAADPDRGEEEREFLASLRDLRPYEILRAVADRLRKKHYPVGWNGRLHLYRDARGIYTPDKRELRLEARDLLTQLRYPRAIREGVEEILYDIQSACAWTGDRSPFNANPLSVPCLNGMVKIDWETGAVTLEPHSPDKRITFVLGAAFDPGAPVEPVRTLFSEWVAREDVDALVQIPAQALLQREERTYKRAYLLEGDRDHAKSTFLNLLRRLFGDEAISHVPLQQIVRDRFAYGPMEHRMLNIYDDLESVPLWHVGVFKELTGTWHHGIEWKGKDRYDGVVNCVHVFSANKPPKIKETDDDAFWSRWVYLLFPNDFPRDPAFEARTFTPAFMSGFLNLIVAAMTHIRTAGLLVAPEPEDIQDLWLPRSDALAAFIEDHTIRGGEFAIPTEEFYQALVDAFRQAKEKVPPKNRVTLELAAYGIHAMRPRLNGKRIHAYQGIRWKEESPYNRRSSVKQGTLSGLGGQG